MGEPRWAALVVGGVGGGSFASRSAAELYGSGVIEQLAHDGSHRMLYPLPHRRDRGGHRIIDLHGDGLALAKLTADVIVLGKSA